MAVTQLWVSKVADRNVLQALLAKITVFCNDWQIHHQFIFVVFKRLTRHTSQFAYHMGAKLDFWTKGAMRDVFQFTRSVCKMIKAAMSSIWKGQMRKEGLKCFSNRVAVQEGDFPVPFEESIMSDQNSSLTIPSGWILRNEIQKDGSTLSDFKAKKLKTKAVLLATRGHAIDKGDSQKNLLVRKPRRKHLPIRKAGRKQLPGQNSRSLSVKRSKVLLGRRKHLSGQSSKMSAVLQGKEIIDLEESTGPEDGAGLSAIPDSQSCQATGTPASPFITAAKEIIDLEESTGAEYSAGLSAKSDSLHHRAGGPSPPPFVTAGKEIIDLEDSSGAEDSADLREVPKLISTSLA